MSCARNIVFQNITFCNPCQPEKIDYNISIKRNLIYFSFDEEKIFFVNERVPESFKWIMHNLDNKGGSENDLLILFSNRNFNDAINKFQISILGKGKKVELIAIVGMKRPIKYYGEMIKELIKKQNTISSKLWLLKFEELVLLLADVYKEGPIVDIFLNSELRDNALLCEVVQKNIGRNLRIDQLARLTHKSVSSFKRNFIKRYGLSPGRYMREEKLNHAAKEILMGKRASKIFMDYGYVNVSNFTEAFKKQFGKTTKEFCLQNQHLDN